MTYLKFSGGNLKRTVEFRVDLTNPASRIEMNICCDDPSCFEVTDYNAGDVNQSRLKLVSLCEIIIESRFEMEENSLFARHSFLSSKEVVCV